MKRLLIAAVIALCATATGQTCAVGVWCTLTATGASYHYSEWSKGDWDSVNKQVLIFERNPADGSTIYANWLMGVKPTTPPNSSSWTWTKIVGASAAGQACFTSSSSSFPPRHTYNQFTFDGSRSAAYISGGSCGYGFSDWFALTVGSTTDSGVVTAKSASGANTYQEGTITYSPNTDRVMMYGGFNGGGSTTASWGEWNPNTNSYTDYGAAPRGLSHGHIAAYDPPSGKVIVWGGNTAWSGGTDLALTYLYDPTAATGSRWAAASPAHEPPAGPYACHAYDSIRNRLLVYLGTTNGLWAYTSAANDWVQISPGTGGPDPTSGGSQSNSCAYDSQNDWFLFFGYNGGNDPLITRGVYFGSPVGGTVQAAATAGFSFAATSTASQPAKKCYRLGP